MPVKSIAVTQELYMLFGDNPDFMNDEHYELFIEIACFLGDESSAKKRKALTDAFGMLEVDIQKKKFERSQDPSLSEKEKTTHLLSSTLTTFEREQGGFKAVRDDKWWETTKKERARLYLSFVRADRFRHLLTTGYHWKDPTVSAGHGEFTHRLQWYALIAAGVLSKANAVQVMRKCGIYVRDNPPPNKRGNRVPSTDLWEVLFDRDSRDFPNANFLYPCVDSDLDFRNPNNLNTFLMENPGLPFLGTFLKTRHDKRVVQASDPTPYVAKKAFGKAIDQLSEQEKITLYGIILDGQAGSSGIDFFARSISNMMTVEGHDVPDISVIKRVINKSYPLPYK